MKTSIALASALAFAASGAVAGGIAPAVIETEPMAPVIVEQGPSGSLAGLPGGGLGVGAAVAGVAGLALVAAALAGGDDDDDAPATTTTN